MSYFNLENNFSKYDHIKSEMIIGKELDRNPLVSIVIPTYKRPGTLKLALDSALNQVNFEGYVVIVVDNEAERDTDTEKLIKGYSSDKLYYYKNQENLGMTGNWNRCIELAIGEWFTLLHDDDVLLPTFLYDMLSLVKTNRDIEMLVSKVEFFNKDSACRQKIKNKSCGGNLKKVKNERYLLGNLSPAPGILVKKENALKIGGFKEIDFPCADYVFWMKYHLNYGSYIYSKLGALYRMAEMNSSSDLYEKIIEKSYMIRKDYSKYIAANKYICHAFTQNGMYSLIFAYKRYMRQEEYNEIRKKYKLDNHLLNIWHKILCKAMCFSGLF